MDEAKRRGYTPPFLQKSAERVDYKRVVKFSCAKERTKSAEAIEKKEVHICVLGVRETKRRRAAAGVEGRSK
jgi:hypothetical protein